MNDDPGRGGPPPGGNALGGEPAGSATAPPGADDTLILEQPFGSDSLYALRAAVAAHAAQAGVPARQVPDLVIAVHELATNAIRHGAGHGQLRIWADGGALHCQVSDDGAAAAAGPAAADPVVVPAKPVAAPVDPVASAAGEAHAAAGTGAAAQWPAQHGHGLWLIRQVADRTSVHSGPRGTVATVSFTLPGRPG
jgi:anti-sigma regulatory factor (Ser/Thr protein kinase)